MHVSHISLQIYPFLKKNKFDIQSHTESLLQYTYLRARSMQGLSVNQSPANSFEVATHDCYQCKQLQKENTAKITKLYIA